MQVDITDDDILRSVWAENTPLDSALKRAFPTATDIFVGTNYVEMYVDDVLWFFKLADHIATWLNTWDYDPGRVQPITFFVKRGSLKKIGH